MVAPKLSQVIQSHENNFTWLRLVLSASVIYYHAFGLTFQAGYVDHLTQWLQPVTTVGGLAVQAFFFLSGLFVTQSYFQDPRFWSFAVKRTLRIWPGLFVCLALTTLIAVLVSRGKDDFQYFLFTDIYKYILQTSVFEFKWTVSGIYKDNPSQVLNGPLHTLPLEAKMYVLLGLTGLIGMIRSARRVTLAAGLLGAMCFIPGTLDTLPLHLFNADYARAAICMFLAGMGTYGLANRITIRVWQGVALGLSCWVTQDNWHSFFFYATVCWVLLYLGQTALPWLGRPKQDLSYGIYIYGWPSQQITMALSPSLNPYELTFAALALATLFSFFSWRFIEKPAIQLGKEISRSSRFWAKPVQISVPSRRLFRILASMLVLTMSMMLVCLIALKYRILA